MVRYRLGTIGYAYSDWQGPFYPDGMGQSKWLGFYSGQFDSLELNTTFHAPPTIDRARRWAAQVGPDFRFSVKTSRSITHEQPLQSAFPSMLEFVETVRGLGRSLGPVLIQLPPYCSVDSFDHLDRLLGALPTDVRFAVEFRNASWVQDRTTDMLRHHNVAWVGLDHLEHSYLRRLRATTNFLYIRLVGCHERFKEINREQIDVTNDLHKWHTAILREIDRSQGKVNEVWVLTSNDYAGFAPATLRRFAIIAGVSNSSSPVQSELFAG